MLLGQRERHSIVFALPDVGSFFFSNNFPIKFGFFFSCVETWFWFSSGAAMIVLSQSILCSVSWKIWEELYVFLSAFPSFSFYLFGSIMIVMNDFPWTGSVQIHIHG